MLARCGPIRFLTMEVWEESSGSTVVAWQTTDNALPEANFHLLREGQHRDVKKDGLPAHLILYAHERNK